MMRLQSLTIYPVKSTAGVCLDTSTVEVSGLRHDRRWVVVTPDGRRMRAARFSELLAVTATPVDDGSLTLSASGMPELGVLVPTHGEVTAVDMSDLDSLIDAGDDAAAWFTQVLGRPARLAWQDDPARRRMSPQHGGGPEDPLSLADTGPLLLTTTASLRRLEEWIADEQQPEHMQMARFRPNVVIDGVPDPFVEDDWRTVWIGEVEFRFAEHCDRCVVTTIDPATLARGTEPLRTLGSHRQRGGQVFFGIRIIPLRPGRISIGDTVVAR